MPLRTNEYLSLAALARRLDLPQGRIAALIRSGQVKPDLHAGRTQLFDPRRLEKLAEQIPGARILIDR